MRKRHLTLAKSVVFRYFVQICACLVYTDRVYMTHQHGGPMDKETEDLIEQYQEQIIEAVTKLNELTKTEIVAIEMHLEEEQKMTIHAMMGDEHSPLEDLPSLDDKVH